MSETIPREEAVALCDEIRKENMAKRFSVGKRQCSFCYKRAGGNSEKLMIFTNPLNRGCSQVNGRFDVKG